MARIATGPWFRKLTGWWMTTIGGRQHKLAEGRQNRHLAVQKFHELMLVVSQAPGAADITVLSICELFLQWSARHQKPETVRGYKFYLQSFAEACGDGSAASLKPFHLTAWLEANSSWGPTTQFNAITAVQRAFSWATEQGIVVDNPVSKMKRPRPKVRRTFVDRATYLRVRRGARPEFRRFMKALWETGARPSEVRDLKWSQVRDDRWVLEEHKTDGKVDAPRVIWLTPKMVRLMSQLPRPRGDGHVFLNVYGRPWTTSSVRLQFKRLKDKLKMDTIVTAYQFRHGFVTRALVNGVGEVTIAELVGHQGLEMIKKHYAHLDQQPEHLRSALQQATRIQKRA